MESIGTTDVETRLPELLARAERGESFVITRQGQPVARLVPGTEPAAGRRAQAAETLRSLRGSLAGLSLEAVLASRHEGHSF